MSEPGARNTEIADAVKLGARRVLSQYFDAVGIFELPLPNARRADIFALGPKGEVHIVEVKSSVQDFNSDTKWEAYLGYCDYFYFAVMPSFPVEILPPTQGLILADRFGGSCVRPPQYEKISPARRKSLLISFGRLASHRLHGIKEP